MRSHPDMTRRELLTLLGGGAVALPLGGYVSSTGSALAGDPPGEQAPPAAEIELVLWDKILGAWFPRSLDTPGGGFRENFAEDWSPLPTESKFIVFQARMTWVPAVVARKYPQHRERFLSYARHGLKFLSETMWDATHGGFIELVDAAGRPDPRWRPWKQMYGQAFGIFAAAGAYEATGDRRALDLAIDGFRWIDRCAHDAEQGGYFELLAADGRPVALAPPEQRADRRFPVIGRVGQKSMNAHIHVLEALMALRQVWDDPLLHQRLEEVFLIVRDKIVRPGGHLAMFSGRDFQPLDERSSFGHELETAYLLMEAAELLGRDDDEQTRRVARELVDHSLRWGWDQTHGGFFDEGPPQGRPTRRGKVWWVEAEAMNGLLTVDRLVGREEPRYSKAFANNWAFFRDRVVDRRHGGCFEVVDEAGKPLPGRRAKATRWKTAYHVTRALLFAIDTLLGQVS